MKIFAEAISATSLLGSKPTLLSDRSNESETITLFKLFEDTSNVWSSALFNS